MLVPAQPRQEGGKQVSSALLGNGFQPSLLGGNMAESFYISQEHLVTLFS